MNSSPVNVAFFPPSSYIVSSETYIMSPMIACKRLDLPQPTSPIMQTNSPCLMLKSMLLRHILDPIVLSLTSSFAFSTSLSSSLSSSEPSESESSYLLIKPHEKLPLISRAAYPHLASSTFTSPYWVSSSMWNFYRRRIALQLSYKSCKKEGSICRGQRIQSTISIAIKTVAMLRGTPK